MTTKENDTFSPGTLSFRMEGANWNAYFGNGAAIMFVGSINARTVRQNEVRKQQFMDLMRGAVDDLLESVVNAKPNWQTPVIVPGGEHGEN